LLKGSMSRCGPGFYPQTLRDREGAKCQAGKLPEIVT